VYFSFLICYAIQSLKVVAAIYCDTDQEREDIWILLLVLTLMRTVPEKLIIAQLLK
jgi:hypothetical protein